MKFSSISLWVETAIVFCSLLVWAVLRKKVEGRRRLWGYGTRCFATRRYEESAAVNGRFFIYTVSEGSDETELPWLIQRCPRDDIKTRHGVFDVPGEGNSAWNRGRKSLPVQREGCLLLVFNEKLHSVLWACCLRVCREAGAQRRLDLAEEFEKGDTAGGGVCRCLRQSTSC